MLWVTERTGKKITRIDPATGKISVAIIDEVSAPDSGMACSWRCTPIC